MRVRLYACGLAVFGATTLAAQETASLSLSEAVQVALTRNLNLLSSVDAEAAARARESAAFAQFLPQLTPSYRRSSDGSVFGVTATQRVPWSGATLSAAGSYRRYHDSLSAFRTSDVFVTLSQPLLRGFGPTATNYELTNSRRAREAQQRNLELNRQRLAVEVTAAFFQVVRQRKLIEVSEQSLTRSEALRDASQARMQVGLASRLDVLRAELQAAQAQEALLSGRTSLQTALERFRILLGASPHEPLGPGATELPEPGQVAAEETTELLVERALASRLELVETRAQVGDSERAFRLARQNLLPQLDVQVTYSQLGSGGGFGDALRPSDRRTLVSFATSYPTERTSDRVNRSLAELDVEARQRALRQREMEVEAEVRSVARNLDRIRTSAALQTKTIDLAEQQRQLATLRYQRGLASNFDVVDAETAVVAARTALAALYADYQVARYELLRATGRLSVEREFAP